MFLSPDPPPPVVEITAPSVATGGSSTVAVHCMVTTVAPMLALLTPQSHVELLKKGEVLPVATSQSLNLSHTLSPVLASHAGRYYCRSVLVVEGLDEPLSHNATHVLTVTSKLATHMKTTYILHVLLLPHSSLSDLCPLLSSTREHEYKPRLHRCFYL